MATLGLFAVHDVKAAQYLPPFASMNEGTAQRQFASAVMNEGHDFNVHAADYSLWSIGEFDTPYTGHSSPLRASKYLPGFRPSAVFRRFL